MLNQKLAQELVEKASAICGYNTHITNTEGIIIGASDRTRIGQFHEATLNIIKQRRYCEYTAEEAAKIRGTRAGSGSPIFFRGNIVGIVSISGEPNEIRKYGELVRNQVEMMCEQAFQYEFSQLEYRAKEAFVQEIIRDSDVTFGGQFLGYDLTIPRIAVLFEVASRIEPFLIDQQRLREDIMKVVNSFSDKQDIASFITSNRFVLLMKFDPTCDKVQSNQIIKMQVNHIKEAIKSKSNLDLSIGIGEYYSGTHGLANSYKDAFLVLEMLKKYHLKPDIHHINKLILEQILNDVSSNTVKRLISSPRMVNLFNNKHREIIKTFRVFCSNNLNTSETSRAMFLHRNTLLYRLNKIKQLTDLDPNNFSEAMQLNLLLNLAQIHGLLNLENEKI